jgi:hypothetical protein
MKINSDIYTTKTKTNAMAEKYKIITPFVKKKQKTLVVFSIKTNLETLDWAIELLKEIPDRDFLNKLIRVSEKRHKEKNESNEKLYKTLIPGCNN